jgi:hypothetical protein
MKHLPGVPLYGRLLALPTNNGLGWSKHSSLLQKTITYSRKKFYNIGPRSIFKCSSSLNIRHLWHLNKVFMPFFPPSASSNGKTQTLDLGMTRRVFYLCAAAAVQAAQDRRFTHSCPNGAKNLLFPNLQILAISPVFVPGKPFQLSPMFVG